jgi:hypothetical protein
MDSAFETRRLTLRRLGASHNGIRAGLGAWPTVVCVVNRWMEALVSMMRIGDESAGGCSLSSAARAAGKLVALPASAVGVAVLGLVSLPAATYGSADRAATVKRIRVGNLSVEVPREWQRVKPSVVEPSMRVFMTGPDAAVTFSVASGRPPVANVVVDGLSVRRALGQGYSGVRGRLVHLQDILAYQIDFRYTIGSRTLRGVKYVVANANVLDVVTYEAPPDDAAALDAFARSANSLRWVRGPHGIDIRSITVSRPRRDVVRFAFRFRYPTSLTKRTDLQLLINTDHNTSTGVQGAEYALDYSGDPPSAELLKPFQGNIRTSRPPTLRFSKSPTSATFQVDPRYLGGAATFEFWAFASTGRRPDDIAPSNDLDSFVTGAPPVSEWTYPATTGQQSRFRPHTYRNP